MSEAFSNEFLAVLGRLQDTYKDASTGDWRPPDGEYDVMLDDVKTGTRQIRRNLTLQVEANDRLQMEREAQPPYDAVLEIWFDDAAGLLQLNENDEIRTLLKRMETLQADFVDFQASSRFFTEWVEE